MRSRSGPIGSRPAAPVRSTSSRSRPGSATAATPAIVDYHGGAFFLSTMRGHLAYAEHYARGAGCRVFLPEYRLSLDHPFPAALDDAYASLEWVHANAATLGVDRERIVLLGDSAGGALAAGVTQRALDERGPKIRAQVLIYPVTDHETKTGSARGFTDTPGWTSGSNRNMWKLYLRGHGVRAHRRRRRPRRPTRHRSTARASRACRPPSSRSRSSIRSATRASPMRGPSRRRACPSSCT